MRIWLATNTVHRVSETGEFGKASQGLKKEHPLQRFPLAPDLPCLR